MVLQHFLGKEQLVPPRQSNTVAPEVRNPQFLPWRTVSCAYQYASHSVRSHPQSLGVTTCRFVLSMGRELLATEHGLQSALTIQPGSSVQSLRSRQRPRASPPYHSRITHSRHRTALGGPTKGHQPGRFRIREDDSGVCRTPEDTAPTRFGTVRPRVQIPGPRPVFPIQM